MKLTTTRAILYGGLTTMPPGASTTTSFRSARPTSSIRRPSYEDVAWLVTTTSVARASSRKVDDPGAVQPKRTVVREDPLPSADQDWSDHEA